tara:strand:+ start:796 stop:1587 length:792 start_codon:yes stop_codon:yes gene_type:complete
MNDIMKNHPLRLSVSDLNTEVNHEPRVHDLRLAEILGFDRYRNIRKLIARHKKELELYGSVCSTVEQTSAKGGRPATEYWLNEGQALCICSKSDTAFASDALHQIITTYIALRNQRTQLQSSASVHVDMKALHEIVQQEVASQITRDQRVAALAYVSVRELLEEHDAIQKGRSGLNRRIGARMRTRAAIYGVQMLRSPHSGVWLFPRDFAAQYMRDEGRALVADHNARQTGQAVMQFGPRRKGRNHQLSVIGKGDSDGKGAPA